MRFEFRIKSSIAGGPNKAFNLKLIETCHYCRPLCPTYVTASFASHRCFAIVQFMSFPLCLVVVDSIVEIFTLNLAICRTRRNRHKGTENKSSSVRCHSQFHVHIFCLRPMSAKRKCLVQFIDVESIANNKRRNAVNPYGLSLYARTELQGISCLESLWRVCVCIVCASLWL